MSVCVGRYTPAVKCSTVSEIARLSLSAAELSQANN